MTDSQGPFPAGEVQRDRHGNPHSLSLRRRAQYSLLQLAKGAETGPARISLFSGLFFRETETVWNPPVSFDEGGGLFKNTITTIYGVSERTATAMEKLSLRLLYNLFTKNRTGNLGRLPGEAGTKMDKNTGRATISIA